MTLLFTVILVIAAVIIFVLKPKVQAKNTEKKMNESTLNVSAIELMHHGSLSPTKKMLKDPKSVEDPESHKAKKDKNKRKKLRGKKGRSKSKEKGMKKKVEETKNEDPNIENQNKPQDLQVLSIFNESKKDEMNDPVQLFFEDEERKDSLFEGDLMDSDKSPQKTFPSIDNKLSSVIGQSKGVTTRNPQRDLAFDKTLDYDDLKMSLETEDNIKDDCCKGFLIATKVYALYIY